MRQRICRYSARAAVTVLLIATAIVLSSCGENDPDLSSIALPASTPAPPLTSAEEAAPGNAGVGVVTMAFEDTSRPTMPNGTYSGSPTRKLTTDIWYPTLPDPAAPADAVRNAALAKSNAPYPLIMYSHGFMGTRTSEASSAVHLASHGYVVASPDFPLTNFNAPGGPTVNDVVNQPGDVSFLVTKLLQLNADPQSPLAGAVDAQRIAAAGLSLGGLTTYLVAFHPTVHDPRIKAAAPLAGPGCFFGDAFFSTALPLLIVHGDIDAIVPYQQNAVASFTHAHRPKYLITLRAGSHTGFTDAADLFTGVKNPDTVGCGQLAGTLPSDDTAGAEFLALLGGPSAGIVPGDCPAGCASHSLPPAISARRQHELTRMTLLPFFEGYLRNDSRSRQFLQTVLAAENAEVSVQADL